MIPRKAPKLPRSLKKAFVMFWKYVGPWKELAIELACQRMTDEEIKQLGERQNDFKNAIHKGDAMNIARD